MLAQEFSRHHSHSRGGRSELSSAARSSRGRASRSLAGPALGSCAPPSPLSLRKPASRRTRARSGSWDMPISTDRASQSGEELAQQLIRVPHRAEMHNDTGAGVDAVAVVADLPQCAIGEESAVEHSCCDRDLRERLYTDPRTRVGFAGDLAPCDGVSLPRLKAKPQRFLDHTQLQQLADAAGGYRVMVLVLGLAGLRIGECAALHVADVDLLRRRLRVSASVSEISGELVWSTPKTHQSRDVPIPRYLADLLAEEIAGKAPGDPLFCAPEGGPLRHRNWRRRVLDPAAATAGLTGLTPHVLRTPQPRWHPSGATVKHVQRMLATGPRNDVGVSRRCSTTTWTRCRTGWTQPFLGPRGLSAAWHALTGSQDADRRLETGL